MKKICLLIGLLFITSGISYSQVTNLMVDSTTNNFTMTSGSQISWSYNVPNNGDTTLVEIWIDTGTEYLIHQQMYYGLIFSR